MNNLDDSEKNAKVSDSAYSNSCSNSQSRKSNSTKSTHSGSNSSGSSGYGGLPSTAGSSNQPPEKRIKEEDPKKEKQALVDIEKSTVTTECRPPDPLHALETPHVEHNADDHTSLPGLTHIEMGPESMDIASTKSIDSKDEIGSCSFTMRDSSVTFASSHSPANYSDGFSCVVSMLDGVVVYTTSLTTTLGFPKDMWIGRSFIDFVHPRDRNTLTSQITYGLSLPKNCTNEKVQTCGNTLADMVCRLRRYRGLTSSGFGVKDRAVSYVPFLLKLSIKKVNDSDGGQVYLVIQAKPLFSAYKVPNEVVVNRSPFVVRHAANGDVQYIDTEAVSYLGYLPQELSGENVTKMYHSDDLLYLRQVYEEVVKEEVLAKSKPIRLMTQNRDYVKVETEWSAFVNPWSRKVEFVTAKHFVLEGPTIPDVFQTIDQETLKKYAAEERKHQSLRDSIIKVMDEVLTKPAEIAKQQMTKRCQELATFVEGLTETGMDELRIEIQEAEHSYGFTQLNSTKAGVTYFGNNHQNTNDDIMINNERDSMLGGISPHHDHNDSECSTDTPVSYNQLNFNENLQRYFNNHQPLSTEDLDTVTGEHVLVPKDAKQYDASCCSPRPSNKSVELMSSCVRNMSDYGSRDVDPPGGYHRVRLTETLLCKHNTEMEKELIRYHRETRPSHKGDRDKTSHDNRQKKFEHMARCNATFYPAASATTSLLEENEKKLQPHGVKRTSTEEDSNNVTNKHRCTSPQQSHRHHVTSAAPAQPSATITTTAAGSHWQIPNPENSISNMNSYMLGVGFPQPLPMMSPVMPQQVTAMPGVFPMYYAPAPASPMPGTSSMSMNVDHTNSTQFSPAMQCMMYGPPIYGSPVMYPHVASPSTSHMPSAVVAQAPQYTNTLNPLGLATSNYTEACKYRKHKLTKYVGGWRNLKQGKHLAALFENNHGRLENDDSNITLSRCSEPVLSTSSPNMVTKIQNSDEATERTDEESSYSSFYSSFFKTDSGSTGGSSYLKNGPKIRKSAGDGYKNSTDEQSAGEGSNEYRKPKQRKNITRRKMEPPWTENVCVTSDLIYKYQIAPRPLEEVLKADKMKIASMIQPALVNEQLGQLYMDLQLEGVAARLTLEEGISSSGEETSSETPEPLRKQEYSKLSLIYEADAPLPPPLLEEKLNDAGDI